MQCVSRTLVSLRILEEVELVIVLRIIPLSGLENLRDNLPSLGRKMLGLNLLRHTLCDACLLGTVSKDGRPILCTHTKIRRQYDHAVLTTYGYRHPLLVCSQSLDRACDKRILGRMRQFREQGTLSMYPPTSSPYVTTAGSNSILSASACSVVPVQTSR